jgi:CBS domain-containing protein
MVNETGQAQEHQFDLQAVLRQTRVSDLTLARFPSVSSDRSLEEAAEMMRSESHGSALICDQGQLVGIVTERDLLRLVANDVDMGSPIARHMTASPRTVRPEDTLLDVVMLMDRGNYRRVPVVNDDGRAVGIVDVKAVMEYLVDQVSATIYNQASTMLLTVRSAEGA